MSDIVCLLITAGCGAVTIGLVLLCESLMPRDSVSK